MGKNISIIDAAIKSLTFTIINVIAAANENENKSIGNIAYNLTTILYDLISIRNSFNGDQT